MYNALRTTAKSSSDMCLHALGFLIFALISLELKMSTANNTMVDTSSTFIAWSNGTDWMTDSGIVFPKKLIPSISLGTCNGSDGAAFGLPVGIEILFIFFKIYKFEADYNLR